MNPLKQAMNENMADGMNVNAAPAEQPHPIRGTGGGMADAIGATVTSEDGSVEPAALSEGEFVFPADVVSALGDGSSEAGGRVLQEIIDEVRSRAGDKQMGLGKAFGGTEKTTQESTSSVDVPSWYKAAEEGAMGKINDYANRDYQAYGGDRVAGFTGDQFTQQQGIRDTYNQGQGNLQQAMDMARMQGDNAMRGGPTEAQLAQHMNPYQQNVTDIAMRRATEEADRQRQQIGANAASMNAFGSGRSDLALSRIGENATRTIGDLQAEGSAAGYNQAMNQYNQGQNQLAAGANANLGAAGGAMNTTLQGLNALGASGGLQQLQNQAGLDQNYADYRAEADHGLNMGQIQQQALGNVNTGLFTRHNTSTTTKPTGGWMGKAAGLAMMAANPMSAAMGGLGGMMGGGAGGAGGIQWAGPRASNINPNGTQAFANGGIVDPSRKYKDGGTVGSFSKLWDAMKDDEDSVFEGGNGVRRYRDKDGSAIDNGSKYSEGTDEAWLEGQSAQRDNRRTMFDAISEGDMMKTGPSSDVGATASKWDLSPDAPISEQRQMWGDLANLEEIRREEAEDAKSQGAKDLAQARKDNEARVAAGLEPLAIPEELLAHEAKKDKPLSVAESVKAKLIPSKPEAVAKAKKSKFEEWMNNPMTQMGAKMLSSDKDFFGALGDAVQNKPDSKLNQLKAKELETLMDGMSPEELRDYHLAKSAGGKDADARAAASLVKRNEALQKQKADGLKYAQDASEIAQSVGTLPKDPKTNEPMTPEQYQDMMYHGYLNKMGVGGSGTSSGGMLSLLQKKQKQLYITV